MKNIKGLNYLPFIVISISLIISYLPILNNPIFPGDQGHRLDNADHIIVGLGHRIWLPFLQAHVYLLHQLKAPLFAYKLIPLSYMFLFLFMLNKLCMKILGTKVPQAIFSLALLFCFAYNSVIHFLGIALYQEIIVIGLFYFLLYLYYFEKKPKLLFFIILFLAMLTREDFWVYYAVFGLVFLLKGQKVERRHLLFLLYLAIPVAWFLRTRQPITLGVNTADVPLNSDIFLTRITILYEILQRKRLLLVILGLAISYIIIILKNRRSAKDSIKTFQDYCIFSLISLFIIYIYIIGKNPWQATPFNQRIIVPLLTHLPFWIIILYKASLAFSKRQGNKNYI